MITFCGNGQDKQLQDYLANPDACDNQRFLANPPTPEIRKKIIKGHIKALQKQIDRQTGNLKNK